MAEPLHPTTLWGPDFFLPSQQNIEVPLLINQFDLALAQANGFKPLALQHVLAQTTGEPYKNLVLSTRVPFVSGRHLRILEVDGTNNTAKLKSTNPFGNRDTLWSRLVAQLDQTAFTGISIQHYTLNGEPITLDRAVGLIAANGLSYPPGLEFADETILWSSPEGMLVSQEQHPYFSGQ